VRQALQRIEHDLDDLAIDPPSRDLRGEQLWPAMQTFGTDHLGPWSIGIWPGEQHSSDQTGTAP
jgi:hypothetical protein